VVSDPLVPIAGRRRGRQPLWGITRAAESTAPYITTFEPRQTYYWRTRTATSYAYGEYSAVQSFSTPPVEASATITPEAGGTLIPDPGNITITFSPGAVSNTTTISYTLQPVPGRSLANFRFAGRAFTLRAFGANGLPITTFNSSFTITIKYDSADLQAADIDDPSKLNLYFWNDTGCAIDTANRRVTLMLNHLTEFALAPPIERELFLPMIVR
jgi:hypothetical protein